VLGFRSLIANITLAWLGRFLDRLLALALLISFLSGSILSAHAESAKPEQERQKLAIEAGEPVTPFRDCDVCPEMVVIPGGSFLMGSPEGEKGRYGDEGPRHEVAISRFALGRHEVTRLEFAHFIAQTGHTTGPCVYWEAYFGNIRRVRDLDLINPSHQRRQTGQHPVACISFGDAQAYVDWLSKETGNPYRLPSESEWEYAARARTRSPYFWGEDAGSACDYANGHDETGKETNLFNWESLPCDDSQALTAPVGSYNANGFSLSDMAGNLWEWVEDHYHESYEGAPADGRAWLSPTRSTRVLRGGSWEDEPRDLRSARRIWSRPGSRLNSSGFRVALTLNEDAD